MERVQACRSCGANALEVVLSLGEQPLANSLLDEADLARPEPRYPLTLAFCTACALGQILETVPPQALFSDYVYFSSYSDGMLLHAKQSTAELIDACKLGLDSLVVEVASNDGYQLQFFQRAGIPVLGIEPAENVARVAEQRGIPTRVEFFGDALARELVAEGRRADVILGYNVMAHVPDQNGFVAGLAELVKHGGIVVIEVPDAAKMLEIVGFDTIYHEHLCYFSLSALRVLFARHNLGVFRVQELPLHGGSLRVYAAPTGLRAAEPSVAELLERDREQGLVDGRAWRSFGARVETLRGELLSLLNRLRAEGRRLAAYGAAAKGATLVNYFGLGADRIEFVADRSPHKQGRYMPGVHIPIRDADALAHEQPDDCLLLAWNFADEILEQQEPYRRAGGRFIVPLPEPRLL